MPCSSSQPWGISTQDVEMACQKKIKSALESVTSQCNDLKYEADKVTRLLCSLMNREGVAELAEGIEGLEEWWQDHQKFDERQARKKHFYE